MNTSVKIIEVLECCKCGDIYMTVDDVPIRLAFPRKPGFDKIGKCPKHN